MTERRKDPEIRFTWNTHWGCNYRCSYCFFHGLWEHYAPRNVYKSAEFWIKKWNDIHALYGRCYIVINGGEPFTYPDFQKIALEISKKHFPINITTNASIPLDDFLAQADPGRISLSLSFHPEYHDPDKFIRLLSSVRSKGFHGCNNIVAYPGFMDRMEGYLKKFEDAGHALKINPFIGEYRGKKYPEALTQDDKQVIGMDKSWGEDKKRRKKICPAGHKSALILPDGGVTRCGQIGDRGIFSSIFDDNFRLLDAPAECDADFCPCDEWKTIPEATPEQGSKHYLP